MIDWLISSGEIAESAETWGVLGGFFGEPRFYEAALYSVETRTVNALVNF